MKTLTITILALVLGIGPMDGYSRDKFPHWNQVGPNCNVRDLILERDGTFISKRGCNVVGGKWYSWYDGKTLTNPREVDIDHIVPLAEAWRSGANTWTRERRQEFANDAENLWAASSTSNRAKGDQGIDDWLPKEHHCIYITQYTYIKLKYDLAIQQEEKDVIC